MKLSFIFEKRDVTATHVYLIERSWLVEVSKMYKYTLVKMLWIDSCRFYMYILVFTYTCVENLFALKTIVLEKPSKLRFIFKLRTIFKRSSNLFYSWRQWDLAKIASDLAFWTRLSLSIVYLIVVT